MENKICVEFSTEEFEILHSNLVGIKENMEKSKAVIDLLKLIGSKDSIEKLPEGMSDIDNDLSTLTSIISKMEIGKLTNG